MQLGIAAALLVLLALWQMPDALAQQQIVGWVEPVRIEPDGILLKAKMDTGARTSALYAHGIQRYEHNGAPWVRFDVLEPGGKADHFDRPVVREVKIRRRGGGLIKRPVVELGLCIGSHYEKAQVDLADRSGFTYPLLVGRLFLQRGFLVDPQHTLLTRPHCKNQSSPTP